MSHDPEHFRKILWVCAVHVVALLLMGLIHWMALRVQAP